MATRTVITGTVAASYDHIHSRTYNVNEQYPIGSYLMPQPLSTRLVAMGKATEDSTAVDAPNTAKHAIYLLELNRDGAETQAYDATDPRWPAHIAAWHRG